MLLNALTSGNIWYAVLILAVSLPAVVICLTIHEASHGFAAYWLGDDTAKRAGRLTLSPRAHVDPIGFLCLLLFGFGWARPVPVNISNFKKPKAGMAITALAGPVSNFITAFVFYVVTILIDGHMSGQIGGILFLFFNVLSSMSVGLGVFNLIPVYPLDGSRVLDAFLPFSLSQKMQKYQGVILLVFVLAIWFGWIDIAVNFANNFMYRSALRFLLFIGLV